MTRETVTRTDQLEGDRRNFPDYEVQTNFTSPWEGGWWRVSDIVRQQKLSAIAALDIAARNREMVLRNAYLKAKRQTERGEAGDPAAAYVIPADQHDPLTALKMVNRLQWQGVEVRRADRQFTHEGKVYGPGTHVVTTAQPKRGVIRWLLGRTFYTDGYFTRAKDGSPIHPYDLSTHTMYEFMGVDVDPVETAVEAAGLRVVDAEVEPAGDVEAGDAGYSLDGRLNDAFHAVNLLWDEGVEVRRVDRAADGSGLRPGDFLVPADAPEGVVSRIADETGVDFRPLDEDPGSGTRTLDRLRIGMYQPYWGGNMDEGWTRWILERYGFAYQSLTDRDVREGDLSRFDAIVLSDQSPRSILHGHRPGTMPPEYTGGIGLEGTLALKEFVEAGGLLQEPGDLLVVPVAVEVPHLGEPGAGVEIEFRGRLLGRGERGAGQCERGDGRQDREGVNAHGGHSPRKGLDEIFDRVGRGRSLRQPGSGCAVPT
jgi:hypothetical protein